ncbi:MAG: CaiB/BaiF CoA transferase family protein [Clostridia bacterium]
MTLLKHVKILDFSGLLPGPYATMMLADLGAEVLRVESPTRPDLLRETPPFDGGESVAHGYLNRSKRSIALDLKQPEAIEVIKQLVPRYDVVLEQFRPGVMERLGLGYETLQAVNPRLIYCSLTGFGQNGPYRDRPGHDNNYLAISGLADYSRRHNERPVPQGVQIADLAGGSLHTVIGILAALLHREKTGEGQYIDVSMTDATFALNAMAGPGYLAGNIAPKAEQTMLNGGSFYDYYETKDGRFYAVGSLEPPFRKLLVEAIGQPELQDMAMSEHPEHARALKEAIRKAFLGRTFEEWLPVFQELHACVEPVLTFAEAVEHPQLKAREMIAEVPRLDGTHQRQIAFPIKFSAGQPSYRHTGARLGQHTAEVLSELGYKEEQLAEWKSKRVF